MDDSTICAETGSDCRHTRFISQRPGGGGGRRIPFNRRHM